MNPHELHSLVTAAMTVFLYEMHSLVTAAVAVVLYEMHSLVTAAVAVVLWFLHSLVTAAGYRNCTQKKPRPTHCVERGLDELDVLGTEVS